jgi:hypothetical protein
MPAFDAATEEWLARLLEKAVPLSSRQQDLIAGAFRGAFTARKAKSVCNAVDGRR